MGFRLFLRFFSRMRRLLYWVKISGETLDILRLWGSGYVSVQAFVNAHALQQLQNTLMRFMGQASHMVLRNLCGYFLDEKGFSWVMLNPKP